jgi:hypothetical protein
MTNHLFANTLNKVIFISLPVAYTFFNESINSYSLKNNAAAVLGHPQP